MDWALFGLSFAMGFVVCTIAFRLGVALGKKRGENIGYVLGWQQYESDMLPLRLSSAKAMAVTEHIIEQARNKDETRPESD